MKTNVLIGIGALLVAGASSFAIGQGLHQASAVQSTISVRYSNPVTDSELRKLGIKRLNAADVERMATTLTLLGRARAGGGGGGRRYSCDSETNVCSCSGPIDCIDVIDECRTPPRDPSGNICTGGNCTCTWH